MSPDMVIVRWSQRGAVEWVDIVDLPAPQIESSHREKREAYEPLRKAMLAHLRIRDDKVTVQKEGAATLQGLPNDVFDDDAFLTNCRVAMHHKTTVIE